MKNEETLKRLKIAAGHLGGVIRMVEQDAYCIDVIRQIQAVQAALNKVSAAILENHLNSCDDCHPRGESIRAGARFEGNHGCVRNRYKSIEKKE